MLLPCFYIVAVAVAFESSVIVAEGALLLLLKVFVEMLHRFLAYLFVFYPLFSFLFGFLCSCDAKTVMLKL